MPLTMNDIITINVSESTIQKAKEIREERDKKYGNIFPEEESDMRWVGEIGEIVTNSLLSHISKEHTNWILDDVTSRGDFSFFNLEIDVKTVKRRVPIRPWYKAQISQGHAEKNVDYLLFTCYEYPVKKLHILGAMSKNEFLSKSEHFKEGDFVHKDYQIRKGHEIYAVTISEMTPVMEFIRKIVNEYMDKVA